MRVDNSRDRRAERSLVPNTRYGRVQLCLREAARWCCRSPEWPVGPETQELRRRYAELETSYEGIMTLRSGKSIDAYFVHGKELGRGGFGTVWQATPTRRAVKAQPALSEKKSYAVKRVKLPLRDRDFEMISKSFLSISTQRMLHFLQVIGSEEATKNHVTRNLLRRLGVLPGDDADGLDERTPMVSVIVAATPKNGIGKDGALPWKLPEDQGYWPRPKDMAHFKRVTMAVESDGKQNAVVMGRKTWESIPQRFRPLPGRLNVVLTSGDALYPEGVIASSSLEVALETLSKRSDVAEVFVIGGQQAYKEAMALPSCVRLYVTRVAKEFECDAFFPNIDERFQPVHVSATSSHENIAYDFVVYEKAPVKDSDLKRGYGGPASMLQQFSAPLAAAGGAGKFLHEEFQYLKAIQDIIENGVHMEDRTGVGTRSVFGQMMRFNLRKSFPLLTTKRVFWRGVVEELLWFVKGDTNANHLTEKGVRIWEANGSKEFLEKRGLGHREVGDLGPVYGFQWRHFGAKYADMHTDYTGQGVDQLAECIRKIKEDPTDRRILLSAWNPADLHLMALPPCHMFCQFYVANGELSCLMYQRSCDMGLGVPFNIASYSLLTMMMAQVCGLKPGDFIHNMGNAHVYQNHVEPLKTQLQRTPRPFPVLKIRPDVKDIDGFTPEDFELVGYNPLGKIAMEMAV
ncbi:unnamed protein product [Effrenium voratum]|nr:unnamed protein product [Effrenium voratum]